MSPGFVYVVESSAGLVKIGYTNDPRRRLTMLRTSSPDKLTLLGVVPGTMEDEAELHRLLEPWRVAREWFTPCRAMRPLLDALMPVRARAAVRGEGVLREYRYDHELTQGELAAQIGVKKHVLCNWERGRRPVPAMRCALINRATGIPLDMLRPDLFGTA